MGPIRTEGDGVVERLHIEDSILDAGLVENPINEAITADKVRLFGPDCTELGIMPSQSARQLAEDMGLDVVEIYPGVIPPVCRLMAYTDSACPRGLAIWLPQTRLTVERVTIFGEVWSKELTAAEAIVTGRLGISDKQSGCFRYSAAPKCCEHALPSPFQEYWIPESGSSRYFASRRFGDPDYAELSDAAPIDVRTGAEDGSELGAFSSWLYPIRMQDLNTKVEEYMPFGLIPIYIKET
jgi:hypothetical protein